MPTTLYLHPADMSTGSVSGLVVRRIRRKILFVHGDKPTVTYKVQHGHFDMLGFRADEPDVGVVADRRKAKRVARKAAKRLGMVPRAVWRSRLA